MICWSFMVLPSLVTTACGELEQLASHEGEVSKAASVTSWVPLGGQHRSACRLRLRSRMSGGGGRGRG